jgi:ATP-dependent protease ClpP protease subunit
MFSYNTSTKEIFLYDYIGPEWFGMIDAGAVQEALNAIPGRATVRINSGGGGVDEGIGIYEMLRRHPGGVDVVVDSSAYSIASVIMLAGESLTMARGAAAMLHSPWMMFASGNAKELRKIADMLETSEERLVSIYEDAFAKRDKRKDRDEIKAILDAETWYTAQQALDAGLIDAIDGQAVEPVAAKYRNIPAAIARAQKAGDRTPYPFARESAKLRLRKNS